MRRTKPISSTGRLLTERRKGLGRTQQQIADRLGLQRGAVAHMERDRNSIPGSSVLAVARAYRCDPLQLLRVLEADSLRW